jgi:hypothetical protein
MINNKQNSKGGRNDTDWHETKTCCVFSTLHLPSSKDNEFDLKRYINSRSVLYVESFE